MTAASALAHSAPSADREPQFYADHIQGVLRIAKANAEAVAFCMDDKKLAAQFVSVVADAATYHDLGKLDPDNQAALRQGRQGRMQWDHVDAGVAHLMAAGAKAAAWIVRAHHAPGLPAKAAEFNPVDPAARRLRGGRIGQQDFDKADELTARTDQILTSLLAVHAASVSTRTPSRFYTSATLFTRLALSCLVDGDHADSARYEYGRSLPEPPAPRWAERLERLDAYVAGLPKVGTRQLDRDAFYAACRSNPTEHHSMVACEGPVGIGKTTAVAAWCLRRAITSAARRIFVVAPYTTILSQTAATLRRALLLPDEHGREDEIVAEHHHRAEFQAIESRDLAVLWRAPIIVTTAVQFFETLAACEPARLRKFHGLPGSVVFLDEAHAALPAHLWRQNWTWLRELAGDWGCSFVFASGSLARVWQEPDIVGESGVLVLPDVAPLKLATRLDEVEHARVRFRSMGRVADPIAVILNTPGPRLAVFNTVQTAAIIAERLRNTQAKVLHLSTALCPLDRDRILHEVKRRLDPDSSYDPDWTLVATSLVEAGVDLSFRTALRERFSTASLLQVGGRVNRHGSGITGEVIDFQIDADGGLTSHPGARHSAKVLERFFSQGLLANPFNAASLVTRALCEELRDDHGKTGILLYQSELSRDFPKVAELGRLIDADTALVIVKEDLRKSIASHVKVNTRDLLAGSVQLWRSRIDALGVNPLHSRPGVYIWQYHYDPDFLGYMSGALSLHSGKAFII